MEIYVYLNILIYKIYMYSIYHILYILKQLRNYYMKIIEFCRRKMGDLSRNASQMWWL